jgi:hypothetical protein
MKTRTEAKPFLKWAGGKRQLIEQFDSLYPKRLLAGKIDTYIEPFLHIIKWIYSIPKYRLMIIWNMLLDYFLFKLD